MPIPPPLCQDELQRLDALRVLRLVGTPLEERFERITRLAKSLLRMEYSAISLVEADVQWFKSGQGFNSIQTPRDVSLCGHTILKSSVMVIPDTHQDERFHDNQLVRHAPFIRFYAGCPIQSAGHNIGALCVMDTVPREFGEQDMEHLRDLAGVVEAEFRIASMPEHERRVVDLPTREQRERFVDPLTRVWGLEGVRAVLGRMVDADAEHGVGTGLIAAELCGFQAANAVHGPACGDHVLRTAAKWILAALSERGTLGRIVDDRFLIMLSPCEIRGSAQRQVERLKARFETMPILWENEEVKVQLRCGIHMVKGTRERDLDGLIASALRDLHESPAIDSLAA